MKDNNLVMDVEALLAETKPPISYDDCCIYRVPYDIRELNVKACTPMSISIGPLHHNDQRLQIMEKYKQVYFKKFAAQEKTKLEDLISSLEEVKPKHRQCYSENLKMSRDELVKVISVDACFIVELFYRDYNDEWTDADTLLKPRLFDRIVPDLLLLENQVPFFILNKLYNLVFDSDSGSFLELSIEYFSIFSIQKLEPPFDICHLIDLIGTFYLQQPIPGRIESYDRNICTASAYHEAGVNFKINETNRMLDLQFFGSYLKIPHIIVGETEMLFHNMVAFEQYHYPDESYIIDYLSVMDYLINTEKDVDILVKNGIILN